MRIIYFLFISLALISCNQNAKTDNLETENGSVNISKEEVESVSTPVSDFEIIQLIGEFEPIKTREGVFLNVTLKLKNNTSNTINNVEMFCGLKAQYKNEDNPTYYPNPHKNYSSDLEYLDGPTASQYGGLNNRRMKVKWLSGQTIPINVIVFYSYGMGYIEEGFSNSIFERTPDPVRFIAAYKFIGLDGEYKDELQVDMIDIWKGYQTRSGLR